MATRARGGDQRITIYISNHAIAGRVLRFTETGLEAAVDGEVPRDRTYRFTLHLRYSVVSGEVCSLGQEGDFCRLQFSALTPRDQSLLAAEADSLQ